LVIRESQPDLAWVFPEFGEHVAPTGTGGHPVLKSSRQSPAPGSVETTNPGEVAGSLPARAPSGRAAGVARSVLRDRCEITPGRRGAGVRAALRHALAAHREGVDTEGMQADRVSSPARVGARQGAFLGAFEAASRRYREGVVLTLTARPGESGDMVDTAVAVNESVTPLRDHLRRQTPGSGRPLAVVVREVTERGVLHVHTVVFGVGPGEIDREALAGYWHETRGHGYIVDVAGVERRPSRTPAGPRFRWVFADHAGADTDRGRFVRAYLGEGLCRLRAVAEASPEEIHRGNVSEAWKVSLMWACGLPLVSVSSGLRDTRAPPSRRAVGGEHDATPHARGGTSLPTPTEPVTRSRGESRSPSWPPRRGPPPPFTTGGRAGAAEGRRGPVRGLDPPVPPPGPKHTGYSTLINDTVHDK
jgi:hypothetical protein